MKPAIFTENDRKCNSLIMKIRVSKFHQGFILENGAGTK